jgi:thiol-disulfide isomerase/thioredoxin
MVNKAFIKKNYFNLLLLCFLLLMVFVPSAKAFMLRGLMEIGLFRPGTSAVAASHETAPAANLNGILFKDISGNVVDLGKLKGKVVFLNFWTTWCPPCQAEMPSIQKLYTQFKDDPDFVFLMVDADSKLLEAKKFMQKKNYSMPVYELASNIPEQLFKGTLPTTIVLDKKGRISFNEEGAANYAHKKFIAFMLQLKNNKD